MTAREFIEKYSNDAVSCSFDNGFDYLILLTVAAHESGFGKFCFGNNFFGTKPGKDWKGKTQLLRTTEYSINPKLIFPEIISKKQIEIKGRLLWEYKVRDYFRKYDSPYESFQDYINFLKSYSRYSKTLEFKQDPEKFFSEIGKSGYATDPHYTKRLIYVYRIIVKEMTY
jgi:flagellum-specific peptidoglycan hydrolase FlgJ